MAAKRLDLTGVAELLDLKPRTVERYARIDYAPGGRIPTWPEPGADGRWGVTQIREWNKGRLGQGKQGSEKARGMHACEACGTEVARRLKDDQDGKLKCRPCWTAADPLNQPAS